MRLSLAGLVVLALALVRAAPIEPTELHSKAAQGLRLLDLAEDAEPVWKTEDEKLELMRAGVHFVRSHRPVVPSFANPFIVRRHGDLRDRAADSQVGPACTCSDVYGPVLSATVWHSR